jgi:hypothetical protein
MIQLHKDIQNTLQNGGADRYRAIHTGDVKQRPEEKRRVVDFMLPLTLNAQSSLLRLVHEIPGCKDCLKLMEEENEEKIGLRHFTKVYPMCTISFI